MLVITFINLSNNINYKYVIGFRKGFVQYPYAYLSGGEYSVVVRLNMENFTLSNTRVLDLSEIDSTLGGFSGGFGDNNWACFR